MSTDALTVVNNHLRGIARRAMNPLGGVKNKRALVDEYASADPSILEMEADFIPVSFGHFQGEWIITENANPDRRILYIHGGSWMAGRVEKYRPHIARIAAATSCSVLAIDYRLAPEDPFPTGLEDCVTAYQWMCEHGPDSSTKADKLFIAGDSAGGNLTLASLLVLKDRNIVQPDAAIALSPVTDMTWSANSIKSKSSADVALVPALMPMLSLAYLQKKNDPTTPYASPLFGDLQGLPPVLLQVGEAEILLDDAVRFAKKAQAVGVETTLQIYPEMPHVFQVFAPFLPDATHALECIGEFVKKRF